MIPSQATLVVMAVLVASLVVTGAGLYASVRKNASLRAENALQASAILEAVKARKRVEATLASARKKNAATASKGASAGRALGRAAQTQPEWAQAPVPPAVQEALRDAAKASD